MNDLDDLRSTLETHAGDVPVTDTTARRTAVHHRIGVVRRRRRTGVAVAAVAVVAAVAGVATLPGEDRTGPAPAGPSVYGIDVPQQLDSLGFTYDYVEHVAGRDGRASLRLPATDQPRVVSWGTSGDDDAVRVRAYASDDGLVHDGRDFDDFVVVDAGEPVDVTATVATGEPALAVYELADERPGGVTGAGLTFRQDVAGGHLLAGRVGEPAEADITLDATAAGRGTRLVFACSGIETGNGLDGDPSDDLTVHAATVGAGGEINSGMSCSDSLPVDGAGVGGSAFSSRAGADVTTRFWLTEGPDGPVVDDPDLRFAVAVYALDDDPFTGVPSTVEAFDHTWRLVDGSTVAGTGGATVSLDVPAGTGPALVRGSASATGEASAVRSDFDGEVTTNELGAGSVSDIDGLVAAGRSATLTAAEGDPADYRLTLRLYVRAD